MAEYAANPAPTACLVLVAKRMRKDAKLFKAVQALGGVSEYRAPKRSEYPAWVVDLFATRGRRITYDGASALVQTVGRDLRRLETEAEKVIAYAGDRTELTRDDVVGVVAETAPVSIFDFLNALGARECASALVLLGDLIASGEDIMTIHAMTVRHLRSLLSVRALADRGAAVGEVMREVGMADWQAKNAIAQARRFTPAELSQALRGAASLESSMKSGGGDPRLLFEIWLASVCISPR